MTQRFATFEHHYANEQMYSTVEAGVNHIHAVKDYLSLLHNVIWIRFGETSAFK